MKQSIVEKLTIAGLVLLGTLLHVYWAFHFKSWMQSPDQIAWQLELDDLIKNENFSYKQLIHYPHEGGSFFISLLALCLSPLKGLMPSLTLAALLIDIGVRYLQAYIARVLFGQKVGVLFAIFGILSLPSLLPWSFTNFGLHACSSVFPFLLLYVAFSVNNKERSILYCGLLTGIAISFAYDNLVLIPAYLIFLIVSLRGQGVLVKKIVQYMGFTIIGLLPYIACRLLIDQHFAFEPPGLFQGRDLIVNIQFSSGQLSHLYEVWYNSFPASFFMNTSTYLSPRMHAMIAAVVMLTAIVLLVRDKKKEAPVLLAAFVVLCFVIVYSLSPVYEDSIEHTSYVDYRHFSYILPLVMLLIIRAFISIPKTGYSICKIWIFVCGVFTLISFTQMKLVQWPLYKPAGWILAKKYGDDPEKLTQLAEAKEKGTRDELMYGYGWGISTTLFQNKKTQATEELQTLKKLLEQFPAKDRPQVKKGIVYSFSKEVTPRLDSAIYPGLMNALQEPD